MANQSLHRLVNTLPIDKLIIHSPLLHSTDYDMVVLVISAYFEREERELIRSLWADPDQSHSIKTAETAVIFVVGRSESNRREVETHGDILEVDVEETYRNMVYKIETAFRWVREKTRSKFVAKIDSDTVVHIDRLMDQLRRLKKERDEFIACFHFPHSPPVRDKCSPWYISEDDYPLSSFPTYCNGPAYVMERQAFHKIINRMKTIKVVEVEDAFFTGIVATDIVPLVCLHDVIVPKYTEYSMCDSVLGPSLSIVPTHYQFGWPKSKRNLSVAWDRLKQPFCHNFITSIYLSIQRTFSCS